MAEFLKQMKFNTSDPEDAAVIPLIIPLNVGAMVKPFRIAYTRKQNGKKAMSTVKIIHDKPLSM